MLDYELVLLEDQEILLELMTAEMGPAGVRPEVFLRMTGRKYHHRESRTRDTGSTPRRRRPARDLRARGKGDDLRRRHKQHV